MRKILTNAVDEIERRIECKIGIVNKSLSLLEKRLRLFSKRLRIIQKRLLVVFSTIDQICRKLLVVFPTSSVENPASRQNGITIITY